MKSQVISCLMSNFFFFSKQALPRKHLPNASSSFKTLIDMTKEETSSHAHPSSSNGLDCNSFDVMSSSMKLSSPVGTTQHMPDDQANLQPHKHLPQLLLTNFTDEATKQKSFYEQHQQLSLPLQSFSTHDHNQLRQKRIKHLYHSPTTFDNSSSLVFNPLSNGAHNQQHSQNHLPAESTTGPYLKPQDGTRRV